MTKLNADHFLSRLHSNAPLNRRVAIEAALTIHNDHDARISEIRNDSRLSPSGRADAIAKVVAEGRNNGHLLQILNTAKGERVALASQRAAFKPIVPNPTDTIAELQRAELRTLIRSMSLPERVKLATTTTDETFRVAITTAIPELSGLPAEVHQHLVDSWVAEKHGAQIAAIDATDREAEAVEVAAQVALDSIARAGVEREWA